MKIKSLLFVFGLSLMSSVFAGNRHVYPAVDANTTNVSAMEKSMQPGYCEIEIINRSWENFTVYGQFEDGSNLLPFNFFSGDSPHYISNYYYGYCHRNMFLDIVTFPGYHVFTGYVRTGVTLIVYSYPSVKAEVHSK